MRPHRHLSYANIASTLALVLAVAGGGAAVAASVGKNTVGSPQIVNGAVKKVDLADDAVSGAKVAPDSLTGADVDESTLELPVSESAGIFSNDSLTFNVPTGTNDPQSTLTFNAPYAGVLQVSADTGVEGKGTGGSAFVQLMIDGQVVRQSQWRVPLAGEVVTQSITGTVEVTAGTHEVTLQALTSNPVTSFYLPQISAVLAPLGEAGTVAVD